METSPVNSGSNYQKGARTEVHSQSKEARRVPLALIIILIIVLSIFLVTVLNK